MAGRKHGQDDAPRKIQSIEVGFRVIRAMEAANGLLPLRDIAAAAGMPASKAHLYLASFVQEGVAIQDPETGRYGLGPFAIQLGLSAIRQLDIVGLSREILVQLSEDTGLAAYLSLWGNRGPSIVSKVDGINQGSLSVRLGYVLPLLVSATGKTFFAYLDERRTSEQRDIELAAALRQDSEAGNLETLLQAAQAEREAVRAQGYAISTNKVNSDFSGIAAPIFDYSGNIVAALTILGTQSAMRGPNQKRLIATIKAAAQALSEKLGASPAKA